MKKEYETVEEALVLAIELLDANYMSYDIKQVRNRIYSWYSHSDVTDPEMLAACALNGEDWFLGATYEDMLDAKNYWFPADPKNEISIWEIESAQRDTAWQE